MTHRFFLGGRDLEMQEIRILLDRYAPNRTEDLHLPWGARLSSYRQPLLSALAHGETPVLAELLDDLPPEAFDRAAVIIVDHHGDRAGTAQPTSIEQVFHLLGLPPDAWTRWLSLVSANDRAHVAGMLAIGASRDEIIAIRKADRAAQGVTADDEAEAARVIGERKQDGRLTIITISGTTSSPVADLMLPALGGPGYDRLMVRMRGEVAVFADGTAIERLAAQFPGSWWGGDLPRAGFWGMNAAAEKTNELNTAINLLRY